MEIIKVASEIHNPLFSRKEIIVEIKNNSSPKTAEVAEIVSKKFSSQPDSLKIDQILPKFGSDIFTVHAKIYSSKKDLDDTEFVKKKKEGAKK